MSCAVLNNLTSDNIVVGQELLLGLGGPSETTPTPGPSPTPTPLLPTPSPRPGSGDLCILLYNDINGDAIRQESEPSISRGCHQHQQSLWRRLAHGRHAKRH